MKRVFSTAEAARICGMSTMTMIRRFDAGMIKGYRLPGSGFRKIPRVALVEFGRKYSLPLDFSNGVAAPVREDRDDAASADKGKGAKRVLVVEDDAPLAQVMVRTLERAGFEVRHAANGFHAGFLAGSFRPDAVVLDIMLPGLDGREVCRLMRQDGRLDGTKIIAVTALTSDRDRSEIFEAGVDDYLAKPFALDELVWRVKKLLLPAEAKAEAISGAQ